MNFDEILEISPYSLGKKEKGELLTERLTELTRLHRDKCPEYRRMLEAVGFNADHIDGLLSYFFP